MPLLLVGAACSLGCSGDDLVLPTLTPTGAAKLSVAAEPPSQAVQGALLTPGPRIQVADAAGAPVKAAGLAVTVSLDSTTAQLQGQLTQPTDASGIATFGDLAINGPAGSYTLRFTSAGLSPATSGPIDVGVLHVATTAAIRSLDPTRGTALTPVTVSFSVTASSGTQSPTGTVTISDGTDGCTASAGAGSCGFTPTTGGDKTVTLTYPGDGAFQASRATLAWRVDRVATTATAPEVQPGPYISRNSQVTFSTHVAAAQGTISGNVVFARDGCGADGTAVTGAAPVQPDGSATATTSFADVGSVTIFACYSGTAAFAPAASSGTAVLVLPW